MLIHFQGGGRGVRKEKERESKRETEGARRMEAAAKPSADVKRESV